MRFLPVAALVAVSAGVATTLADKDATAQPTIPPSAIPVSIGSTPDSRPVPRGFLGLSIEYRSAPGYFGTPTHPDPVFLQLVRNLTPGQSPVIRFGGDTTDWTWTPTSGVARPPGIRYTLTPEWMASTRTAARALDARIIAGVNFESDSARIAAAESAALLRGIGWPYLAGLELGNEPEVYGTLGWYQTSSGVPVPGRPPRYGFGPYLRDYAHVSGVLPRRVGLVGPASGAPRWLSGLARYLNANPRVRLVTFHRYPLHRCFTPPTSPAFPSIPNLLAPVAASGPATSLAAAIRVAHARGIPFRADELNSVSCGGARGVSDTFASALWVLDTLFNMTRAGVDGVNIHTFQKAIYEPFAVAERAGRWTGEVRPMYYGLLMFARAAPPGSRLLPVSYRAPATLRIWSARAPGGSVRLVLINDSRRRPATVAVRPPAPAGSATGVRLRAPHADARSGVTLGGQGFGSATTTGALAGPTRTFVVHPVQGRLVVRLPPASATLLRVTSR
ncbi:MAG: glycosyl hydrolase family 79 C-terminal domain-containing protein [Solirubrobacteraceae bacterium]